MDHFEPSEFYQAPKPAMPGDLGPDFPPARPGVLTWFAAYCWLFAALYILLALGMLLVPFLPVEGRPEEDRAFALIGAVVMTVVCVGLAALFIAGPLLPRRPWAWVYNIILIAIGLTSCCTWPATIPLLIYWIKPEVKRYYGG